MNRTMPNVLLLIPCLAATALCQLPAPTLQTRVAPRAVWTAVSTSGTCTLSTVSTTGTFRSDAGAATSNDAIYVFGGSKDNNTAFTYNDVWRFDPAAGTFTQLVADQAVGSPHARARHASAWNPLSGKMVIFGGNNRGTGPNVVNTLRNDIWEFDPITNTFTDVTPASGPAPSPREFAAMAFDPGSGGMLMFGGRPGILATDPPSNETWLFLGGSWLPLGPATSPAARMNHSLVTRPEFSDVLMVCGLDQSSGTSIGMLDVWRWSSLAWTQLNTGATSWPHGIAGNTAVYDVARQRVVLQGGQGLSTTNAILYGGSYGGSPSNFTSEYDPATNAWTIYGNPITGTTPYNNNDPVIGRISRYSAGYVAGKVYKISGQNPVLSGSKPALNVYAYQAPTMASTVSYGLGCTGPGGALSLVSGSNPWTERTWSGTASGFGPNSLAFFVVGLATSAIPLNALFPQGGLGCDLLNTTDVLTSFLFPAGGQVGVSIGIPSDRVFAGLTIHAQVAELQFDLASNWIGLFTTNGLSLTIGAL
jgi:hypothetical protein